MAGIEAYSDSRLVFYPVDDPTQLQKTSANSSSPPWHVFQHYNILAQPAS